MRRTPSPTRRSRQDQSFGEAMLCFLQPILKRPVLGLIAVGLGTAFVMTVSWAIISPGTPSAAAHATKFVADMPTVQEVTEQQLPSADGHLVFRGKSIHMLVGGKGAVSLMESSRDMTKDMLTLRAHFRVLEQQTLETTFVLLHGGSKRSQNAGHWTPFTSELHPETAVFRKNGAFLALDAPGHGKTAGHGNIPHEVMTDILGRALAISSEPVVAVGRSWGGGVTVDTLAKLSSTARSSHICAVILIAPATGVGSLNRINADFREKTPLLLVWQKDDNVIPFSRHEGVENSFKQVTTMYFDPMPAGEGVSPHTPELNRPAEFAAGVEAFLRTTNCPTPLADEAEPTSPSLRSP